MNFKDGENLVFLFGQARSGTTLLQRLLGQNSEIFTYSEGWILLQPLFALKEKGTVSPFYGHRICVNALNDFLTQSEYGKGTYF